MARAAAIARNADLAVIVRTDERLAAYVYSTGTRADTMDWLKPAPDWTRALAITPDARILARGGLYPAVALFDLPEKRQRMEIPLGEQGQTRSLAFSSDGRRLAIDYQAATERVVQNRLRILSVDDGRQIIDVEAPTGSVRSLAFLPSDGNTYWLASTSGGAVRICDTSTSCQVGDRMR